LLANNGENHWKSSEMYYDSDYENEYIDSYWQFNVVEKLFPDLFSTLETDELIGTNNYFSWMIL
jgi:hypothetical protein